MSKTPQKNTNIIFNAIKNKLKKDLGIGMGVKGESMLHKNYFYDKKYAGKKIIKTDLNNVDASIVELNEI